MDLKSKLFGSEEERAVSPVIGVILMVAITVILAAVIAAFVLDLGGSLNEEAQAGANIDVDEPEKEIVATWTAQGNSDNLYVTIDGENIVDNDTLTEDVLISDVGKSERWTHSDLADDVNNSISGTVTVVAEIEGGSSTVVATESFEMGP